MHHTPPQAPPAIASPAPQRVYVFIPLNSCMLVEADPVTQQLHHVYPACDAKKQEQKKK